MTALSSITFVSEAAAFGGHERMALRAANALSRMGLHVVFRCWHGNARLRKGIDEENDRGARIVPDIHSICDFALGSLRWWMRRSALDAARRWLDADRSDVRVLVQGRIDSGLVTAHAGAAMGRRLISYVPMAHLLEDMGVRSLPAFRERVLALHYRAPAGYVTIDAGACQQLRMRGVCRPIEVVENWIPAPGERPDRDTSRTHFGLPIDVPVVATVGRIDYLQKGHDHLLGALKSPAGEASGIHWLIVGDGPDASRLRREIQVAGLAARCRFASWMEDGMEAVYAAVDAIVLPSNYEGVPLVMLEALARRVPVAGTAIDGMARWLPSASTFDRNAPISVLQALQHAIEQPEAFSEAFRRATAATDDKRFQHAWLGALERLRLADKA